MSTSTPLTGRGLLLLALILFVFPARLAYADNYTNLHTLADGSTIQINHTSPFAGQGIEQFVAFGATIGLNWSALPNTQHRNWFTSGPNKGALDIAGDVYLTGVNWHYSGYFQFSPFLMRDFYWFPSCNSCFPVNGPYIISAHVPRRCCFYHDCPDTGAFTHGWDQPTDECVAGCTGEALELLDNFDTFSTLYTEPPFGGLVNGALTVVDGHGGVASAQFILLEALRGTPNGITDFTYLFGYVAPGQYRDQTTNLLVNRFPGDTFPVAATVFGIPVNPIVKVVQHVSCDVSGASPGEVDAGDLGAIAEALGNCASFCTPGEGCQPDGSPPYCTWRADVNASGAIDAGDISMYAAEANLADCSLSKVGDPATSVDQQLTWFGMRRTGATIVQCGMETPEIEVIDEAQMRRAIADPYGYLRRSTSAQPLSWSLVKEVYR